MQIVLKPMPPDDRGGYVVGTLDGQPLVYDERRPRVGDRDYSHGELADALVEAVDRAATVVLGGEWSKPLAVVTGLNPRTCNRDRIRQWGLPPWVLVLLGTAAANEDARALGDFLLGVSRIQTSARLNRGFSDPWAPLAGQEKLILSEATQALERAADLIFMARKEREIARQHGPRPGSP